MRQDLNEIPARREGHREPQDEGDDDFQAHLFSVTPNALVRSMSDEETPTFWRGVPHIIPLPRFAFALQ